MGRAAAVAASTPASVSATAGPCQAPPRNERSSWSARPSTWLITVSFRLSNSLFIAYRNPGTLLRKARDEHGVIHDPRRAASRGRVLPLRQRVQEGLGKLLIIGLDDNGIDNRPRFGDRHPDASVAALSVFRRRRLLTPKPAGRWDVRGVRQRIGSTGCILRFRIPRRMRSPGAGSQANDDN